MFRRTDPQATFGSLNVLLTPEKIARLEKNHWAGSFRRKAFPVLLANEPIFRPSSSRTDEGVQGRFSTS